MKKIFTICILFVVFASCKKEELAIVKPVDSEIKLEDPSIVPPPLSLAISRDGTKRIISIRGSFNSLHVSQSYHNEDGSINESKSKNTYQIYYLNFDHLNITSVYGDLPYVFKRIAPYTYTFTHTINSVERETNWIAVYKYGGDRINQANTIY